MLILALDTTTRQGSVALWRHGLLEERVGDASRSHAERLPGDIATLLAAHRTTVADVDRYAVASGPGSFTGMRVGIATIQGLALVHDRLVVPIPALEGLARQVAATRQLECGHFVGAWMEAYRGEIFGALYRVMPRPAGANMPAGLDPIVEPRVAKPAMLADAWREVVGTQAIAMVGDAVPTHAELLVTEFAGRLTLDDPLAIAGTLAMIAAHESARAVRPHAIVPLYVRRPDAELARDKVRMG